MTISEYLLDVKRIPYWDRVPAISDNELEKLFNQANTIKDKAGEVPNFDREISSHQGRVHNPWVEAMPSYRYDAEAPFNSVSAGHLSIGGHTNRSCNQFDSSGKGIIG